MRATPTQPTLTPYSLVYSGMSYLGLIELINQARSRVSDG